HEPGFFLFALLPGSHEPGFFLFALFPGSHVARFFPIARPGSDGHCRISIRPVAWLIDSSNVRSHHRQMITILCTNALSKKASLSGASGRRAR
ncbi:MAG TPA: hypothetical protein VNY53_18820, partial [Bradyrhizobium sp.]|nr:hypothetical protein [Bradyrhizobium sp.]